MLFCEYQHAPLGLETQKPRFGWKGIGLLSTRLQRSYQLIVRQGKTVLWDSGEVLTRRSSAVAYEGPVLAAGTRYTWTVRVTTEDGTVCENGDWFEMGLLRESDWQGACWIGYPDHRRGVAPLLRRSFSLEKKPGDARLYLSGLGYAHVTVNGVGMDGSLLDPGWTDYQKTVLYRAWDVTNLLQQGENVLAVELGEGWYGNDHPGFMKLVQKMPSWLSEPKLRCLLQAGETRVISAEDGLWQASDGPIRQNNVFDGETYDGRLEKPGWELPSYEPGADQWKPAVAVPAPGGIMRCQQMSFIGKKRSIAPVYVTYPEESDAFEVVVDLGVNIAGWAEITVTGKRGQKVEMRYAETLNDKNAVDQRNLRNAKAIDTFILGHDGVNTYEPRFTYHGFRYVQVKTEPGVIVTDLRGWQVHSLVEQTGSFRCDNELLQKTYNAIIQTEQNNLHSVPTDCPQRDERLGWVNDMTVRCEEGLYNFDMMRFYEKWLQDLADCQDEETGAIGDTAPYFYGSKPAAHISSAFVLLPWLLYCFYEDTAPMARHFDAMERYVAYKLGMRDENGLIVPDFFGEWAAPMTDTIWGWGENAVPKNVPKQLITTGYLYYDCLLMEKMAALLGKTDAQAEYRKLQSEIKADFNRAFFHEEGFYAENTQGANIFPLFLDLVPEGKQEAVLENLLRDLFELHEGRVSTGNQMTKYLYEVLLMENCNQQAFALAVYDRYPSMGFMFQHGATTIWERWEKMSGNHMNSHDHPMMGAFTVWFQKGLCGLNPQCRTDDGRLLLKPHVVEGLSSASATLGTPRGPLSLAWEKQSDGLTIRVDVPWGDTLDVEVPMAADVLDGQKLTEKQISIVGLTPGTHEIVCSGKEKRYENHRQ